MRKIISVVGARPQFIKAAMLTRALAEKAPALIHLHLHTGPHYRAEMTELFFTEPANRHVFDLTMGYVGLLRYVYSPTPRWLTLYRETEELETMEGRWNEVLGTYCRIIERIIIDIASKRNYKKPKLDGFGSSQSNKNRISRLISP